MLKNPLPETQANLTVPEAGQQVVLTDSKWDPLALVLSPTEDLDAISNISPTQVSISDSFGAEMRRSAEAFGIALERAKLKLPKFSGSPVFLNRLANLASSAGALEEEAKFIEMAGTLSAGPFFVHQRGNNLLARQMPEAAEAVFRELDLATDVDGNLKLAALAVRRRDLEAAGRHIEAAVAIDPTNYGARLFEGGLHLVTGEWQYAVHSLRMAAKERPTSSVVFSNLGIAYIRLGMHGKALTALKRAVALGPLNENAVTLLADCASSAGVPDEAVPALRYYLKFEQTSAISWGRLARAMMDIGEYPQAIDALHHQAALDGSAVVWNNLGVAHLRGGNLKNAMEAFKHAFQVGASTKDRGYFLAALNISAQLARARQVDHLLRFTRPLVASDENGLCLQDSVLSDIYLYYLHALSMNKKEEEFRRDGEALLKNERSAFTLKTWIFASLVGSLALDPDERSEATRIIREFGWLLADLTGVDEARRASVLNNVAFALAEAGELDEARKYAIRIPRRFRSAAYPIATRGLIDFRSGDFQRGFSLYKKAIATAKTRTEKDVLRQKLQVELGHFYSKSDPKTARKHLLKALTFSTDLEAIAEDARYALKQLAGPNIH